MHLKLAESDLFDTLPADPEQATNGTRTPAEEDLVSETAGKGVEAAPENVIGEEGEEKPVLAEESAKESPEITEPDGQEGTAETEQDDSDMEVRDEK
jgi:hypothetical protein